MSEITVTCERLSDGTWVGSIDEDDLHAALCEAEVEAEVEDEGVGAYECWGQCGVDVDYRVTSVTGSAEVTLYCDFSGHEFEDDEAEEAAKTQAIASLTIPNVRTSGDEDGVEYDILWVPSAPAETVYFEAEVD